MKKLPKLSVRPCNGWELVIDHEDSLGVTTLWFPTEEEAKKRLESCVQRRLGVTA